MRRILLVILSLILFSSFHSKEIVINESGFKKIKIGETTLAQIKARHPFSKEHKQWMHAMFRTDEGRVCVASCNSQIRTKGITYIFHYERGQKEKKLLDEILFTSPASIITDKGIKLGVSTLKDVEEKYGVKSTRVNKYYIEKEYPGITFYSNKVIGKDTSDQTCIVTSIRLKKNE